MQLKITGWIRFEKFRGMYAGDHIRQRSRSPRPTPLSSVEMKEKAASEWYAQDLALARRHFAEEHTAIAMATQQSQNCTGVTAPNDDVTVNDIDDATAGPIERPYADALPRAEIIQGNNVTVHVFGVNKVCVNVFDDTVTVDTSQSDRVV